MGVYYKCTSCAKVLHLLPQSPGFGQMQVKCFLCGGQSQYLPTGPGPNDQVVQAPIAEVSSVPEGAVSSLGAPAVASGEVAALTVPLQAPAQLLAQDAAEAAPTLPIEGLSDERIAQIMGSAPNRRRSAKLKPSTDLASTVRVQSDVGILARPESSSALTRRGATPSKPVSEEDIDEEVIPTRAVAGLADRQITAYARDLYGNEITPKQAAPNGPGQGPDTGGSSEAAAVRRPSAAAALDEPFRDSGPLALASSVGLDVPFRGTTEVDPIATEGGPGTLGALFEGPAGVGPNFTGSTPLLDLQESDEPSISESMFDQPAYVPGEELPGPRKRRSGVVIGVIVIVGVFALVFVGLLAVLLSVGRGEPDAAHDDNEPNAVETTVDRGLAPTGRSRLERFDLAEPPSDAPVALEAATARLTEAGTEARLVVSGTLSNQGDTAITAAVIKGSLKVALSEGTTTTRKLSGAGISEAVGIERPWLPGQTRPFELLLTGMPVAEEAPEDRLVWLTIKVSNGKAYHYSGPVGHVDVGAM